MRFLSSPLWRAYTSTYVEGYRLLRGWLEAPAGGVTLTQRFGRLLDEPLIPSSAAGLAERTVSADLRSAVPSGD